MKLPRVKLAWLWAVGKRLVVYGALLALILWVLVITGLVDHWARTAIIARIEKMTGGRVELKNFHFSFLALRAEMKDFTLHGNEPEGTPPLFHADLLVVDVRVDSLLRRKISLDEIRLVRPAVHVRVDAQGRSNVPAPPVTAPAGKPLRERVFDLAIQRVQLEDGELLVNQVRVPLVLQSRQFDFTLDYHQPAAGPAQYNGEFRSRDAQFVTRRYLPTATELAAQFTLTRESFHLRDVTWKWPHSEIHAEARLPQFSDALWEIRYRANLDFADLRRFLRMPNFPEGRAQTSGSGEWRQGRLSLDGKFDAGGIALPYTWFHAAGAEARGAYHATNQTLEVPDFDARLLGGVIRGPVHLEFAGMRFRTHLRMQGVSVSGLMAALDHEAFPVNTFHWDGTMDGEATTAWEQDFQGLDARGVANWSPPLAPQQGSIPVTARFEYHFSRARSMAEVTASHISTPSSRVEMHGRLGAADSSLRVKLDARDLTQWGDFIHALRGDQDAPTRVAGHATFDGNLVGALNAPVFSGAIKIQNAEYGRLAWDQIDGEMVYGPGEFRFDRGTARRGRSSASFDFWLGLQDWGFRPASGWSLAAELVRAPTDELQSLFGTSYPVRGLLTGQFRGRGTRATPEFTGLFDLTEIESAGLKFDRAHGQLQLTGEELSFSNMELRKATGRATGNFRYRFSDANIAFDAAGAVIPIASIEWLASQHFPLSGQLSFQLKGEGPWAAPVAQGTARLVDLGIGGDTLGSFEAALRSDGRRLHLQLTSAMAAGSAQGQLEIQLGGEYPARGEISIRQIDLDVLLQAALRTTHASLTEHSRVDGAFKLEGPLARPRALAVDADLSRISFGYRQVRLENDGPVRVNYRNEEIRIASARLRGADTDFQLSGFARFAGGSATGAGQRLGLNLAGQLNLQLLGGFVPELEARGGARINAAVEGTFAQPRINGRMTIQDASAVYGDFPAALSHVRGDLVFDASRMTFDNVSAEAGGGRLSLGGSITYGDGPLRYDLGINATRVRIRYPQGMSWLLGGALRLAGTTQGALLSGRLVIDRLLLTEGVDFGGLLSTAEGTRSPTATSPFLRNLQFDIEAVTSPNARLEWAAARFECEAQLRVRGTLERPILLGTIRLLSGELNFRDNRYTLTRGDIVFSNPFRLDPTINLEATTTVRQYEVTVNFTGPSSRLNLNYRSDPPLPANDIVTMLALGRSGDERDFRSSGTRQTTPGEGAGQVLSEAISSQIGGRIERLFGVSRFRIDPLLAGTATDPNASARITVEQQVTRDLVVTYVTNVSAQQQQIIQVEYSVNRDISIIALRDLNGTFGLDIKFKKRFK